MKKVFKDNAKLDFQAVCLENSVALVMAYVAAAHATHQYEFPVAVTALNALSAIGNKKMFGLMGRLIEQNKAVCDRSAFHMAYVFASRAGAQDTMHFLHKMADQLGVPLNAHTISRYLFATDATSEFAAVLRLLNFQDDYVTHCNSGNNGFAVSSYVNPYLLRRDGEDRFVVNVRAKVSGFSVFHPFFEACKTGHRAAAEMLLKHTINVNGETNFTVEMQTFAMKLSLAYGSLSTVQWLDGMFGVLRNLHANTPTYIELTNFALSSKSKNLDLTTWLQTTYSAPHTDAAMLKHYCVENDRNRAAELQRRSVHLTPGAVACALGELEDVSIEIAAWGRGLGLTFQKNKNSPQYERYKVVKQDA
jgi:hypothetical protein